MSHILPCWGWLIRETAVAQGVFRDQYTDDMFRPDGLSLAEILAKEEVDRARAKADACLPRPRTVDATVPAEYLPDAEGTYGRFRIRRITWDQHPMSLGFTPRPGALEIYEILPLDSTRCSHGVILKRGPEQGGGWDAVDGTCEVWYQYRSWAIWDLAIHGRIVTESASSWIKPPAA
ncbi:hypothetical protein ASF36_22680 [Methylobacterium sp. Leaf90]|nr:hypothetical protein ASF36_22680 [Methylobacterium sp. Leaf90]